jgi:hypothetical protein
MRRRHRRPDQPLDKLHQDLAELTAMEAIAKAQGYPAGFNYKPQIAKAKLALDGTRRDLERNLVSAGTRSGELGTIPINKTADKFNNAKTWGEAFSTLLEDPGAVVRTTFLRSLPGSAPTLVAGAAGGFAGARSAVRSVPRAALPRGRALPPAPRRSATSWATSS